MRNGGYAVNETSLHFNFWLSGKILSKNNHVTIHSLSKIRIRGIEPRAIAWEAIMLATTPYPINEKGVWVYMSNSEHHPVRNWLERTQKEIPACSTGSNGGWVSSYLVFLDSSQVFLLSSTGRQEALCRKFWTNPVPVMFTVIQTHPTVILGFSFGTC